ncbi:MAG: TolC family outer membrane protein [Deltaproteobacteria bacterium]|jgi:adhesin transport system outer membrane protein|nr:TolC family outer membrane protein [Deltaproteobacteria bacterium]
MRIFIKLLLAASAHALVFGGIAVAADSAVPLAGGGAYTLKDTVDITLKHNPNLKSLQEFRQSSSFDRNTARSGFFPSLDADAGIGFEQWNDTTTRSGTPGTQNRYTYHKRADVTVSLAQTIWDGFGSWSLYRMADANLVSAEHRLFDNAEGLALAAVTAHMEVLRQQKMVQLSELNLSNHQRILGSQLEREKAGASTHADVTQTQARTANAETALVESKLAYESALYSYKRLTGQLPGQLMPATAPNETFSSLNNIITGNLGNNSQILAKRADLDSASARYDMDKSAFHPRIYLEATYNYSDQAQSSPDFSWGSAFMLRGQWNLFNGTYDWYNIKASDARYRQQGMELIALRDNLIKETSSTWSEWQALIQQVTFLNNAVVYNTQTRDMYMQQFNVGSRSLLDVLDSENELYTTSMQLVSAQQNEIAAQYRLLTLAGRILDAFAVDRKSLTPETQDTEDN